MTGRERYEKKGRGKDYNTAARLEPELLRAKGHRGNGLVLPSPLTYGRLLDRTVRACAWVLVGLEAGIVQLGSLLEF